jgi:uncharacterized DUF497 family protein
MGDPGEALAAATGFDWDAGNATKNWLGHAVTQAGCEMVFFQHPLLLAPDGAHSGSESRYYALGRTPLGRELFVVFTMRGSLIRVISARDQSRREREVYQDAQEAHDEDSPV